jgi:hypothetical protein
MSCHENKRLRQHYEAALRHWGNLVLSPTIRRVGTLARQAAEVKLKAFDERNAAKERLDAHIRVCPVCTPKLRAKHKD